MPTKKIILATLATLSFIVAFIVLGQIEIVDAGTLQSLIAITSMAAVGIVVADKELDSINSIDDLQAMKNGLVKHMGGLRDKYHGRKDDSKGIKGAWEGEERADWDRTSDGVDAIQARMAVLRDSDTMEKRWQEVQETEDRIVKELQQRTNINHPDSARIKEITREDRALAMQSWFRYHSDLDLTDNHKNACKKLRFNPRAKRLDTGSPIGTDEIRQIQEAAFDVHVTQRQRVIKRAMESLAATSGAEFIPQGFMAMLEEALFLHANVRNVVDIWRTDSGNAVPWPTASDQEEGEWLGESDPVTEADPTTGNVLFGAHKVGSKAVKVSTELLEDSAFRLITWLPTVLARRIGRSENRACTTGDGVGKPTGIVPGSALGHTVAGAGLAYSDFVRLEHSIDPLDRMNASYMFHDTIVRDLRLLLDADGRPLWQPGLQAGVANRLNGRNYEINQYMDATLASGTKPVVYGDMKAYKLREVRGIRLYRLSELFRLNDQEGFVAFKRVDGKIVDAGTAPIKHMIMA